VTEPDARSVLGKVPARRGRRGQDSCQPAVLGTARTRRVLAGVADLGPGQQGPRPHRHIVSVQAKLVRAYALRSA